MSILKDIIVQNGQAGDNKSYIYFNISVIEKVSIHLYVYSLNFKVKDLVGA